MKSIINILYLISISFLFTACNKESDKAFVPVANLNPDTLVFEPSMKGYELYSWPNGDDWNYSVLPGTNRNKSLEEVTGNRIIVYGKDSLKQVLDKMPAHECITWEGENWLNRIWGGNYGNLSLPGRDLVNEIIMYAQERQINIQINN
jgi:hypothetical protein